ncbi:MAG: sugar phosphate isomerase/epimerase [Candidatus Hydrogenedentes bacterium]|nr:sugar phosphate isomerase/epimerase [Candidatus Hydrogenedentota bacterium]
MDRRTFLGVGAGLGVGAALGLAATTSCATRRRTTRYQGGSSPWPLCLNSSTIRPQTLQKKIEVAAEAGYDGIEPWVGELEEFEKGGGDLKALGKEIAGRGLFVPNVIGLWGAMPAEQDAWDKSLEASRNRMRMAAAIGSQHVAAIPAPDRPDFDLKRGAEQYRELLRIGRDEFGITVALEFVGFLKGVHRLGQAAAIALDANDPDACLIADTFHLFRGDSGFDGIRHLDGAFIADFHWNDVPADPPREQQGDEHRVYPGDGILPLTGLLKDLLAIDYTGPLCLELFNREHWEQDPLVVAETGRRKILEGIAAAV